MLKILLKTRLLALLDRFSGSGKGKKALDTRKITFLVILGIALLGITGYLLSLVLTRNEQFLITLLQASAKPRMFGCTSRWRGRRLSWFPS